MSAIEIIILAFSLSLDAVVVSIGIGALNRFGFSKVLVIAGTFGVFQGVMPVIGWAGGLLLSGPFLAYGNIIGFVLLFVVGLKMLKEALGPEDLEAERDAVHTRTLLALAIATSIDALVAGITFSFIPTPIPFAVGAIGLVTFLGCLLGVVLGMRTRHLAGTKLEILGAFAILMLAIKTLIW